MKMTELVALSSPSFLSPPFSRHKYSTHVLSGSGFNEKYAVDPCSMSGKKFDEVSKIRLKIEEVVCERVKQKRTRISK